MTDRAGEPASFSSDWCNIEWTAWVPFSTTSRTLDNVPDTPGLYRIRPAGQNLMMYIGSTSGSLRQCFSGIRQNATKVVMPKNDPWPVAPALWAWKDAKGYLYEVSSATYPHSPDDLKSAECYLTYCYRLERHESPLCSFGRFHRNYRSPTDEKDGKAGGKIEPGQPRNPAGGPSASPLEVKGKPGDPDWMGFLWSPKRSLKTHTTTIVPKNPGYYLIFDAAAGTVVAIGRSEDCQKALFEISRKPWDERELAYSFVCEPGPVAAHHLMERENDLLGNYIEQSGTVPEFQFRERK